MRDGVSSPPDPAEVARHERLLERGNTLSGQEAIAEYLEVSVETLRRWHRKSAEVRHYIRVDEAGHYVANIGELINLIPHLYEIRSLGRKRLRSNRSKGGQFARKKRSARA